MANFDIVAIGRLSGQLRVPVQQIQRIAKQLGIKPAGRINSIEHYHVRDTERIARAVRDASTLSPA